MTSRDQDAGQAWRAMRRLMFDLHDGRTEVAEALGMSFFRAKALLRLAAGPLTMRQLATSLVSDAPYTTVVVDDLERRGLVERSIHPEDRRVKIVSITTAGAQSAAIAAEIQNRPPAVFSRLSAADAATLSRILSELVADS
ncbi:MAG: MarR family winged helix-turn-helix transcriptional regulator [Jatrophihabitans sp.]